MLDDKENTSGQRPGNGAGAAASSFKLTAHGLQRAPCERPRCVARRHAVKAAKRSEAVAWVRLIVLAWRWVAVTPPALRAALTMCERNAARKRVREAYMIWAANSSSMSIARHCVGEVERALLGYDHDFIQSHAEKEASYEEFQAQPAVDDDDGDEQDEDEDEDEDEIGSYQPFRSPSRGRRTTQHGSTHAAAAAATAAATSKTPPLRLVDTDRVAMAIAAAVQGLIGRLQQRLQAHLSSFGAISTARPLSGSTSAPASPAKGTEGLASPLTGAEGQRHASRVLLDSLVDAAPGGAHIHAAERDTGTHGAALVPRLEELFEHEHDHRDIGPESSLAHEHSHRVATRAL